VYRGASKSLVLTPPQDNYFGEDGFGDFEFPNPPDPEDLLQKKHAVVALIDTVNQYPGMYKQTRNYPVILNDTVMKKCMDSL
jgi:inosine-uridine nucleoside N-ribohydrolase